MKKEDGYNQMMNIIILLVLVVLSFLLIRPIALSIILGLLLVFIFNPLNERLLKKTGSRNFSAGICSAILILILVLPFIFLTPIAIDQSIKVYVASQSSDVARSIQNFLTNSPLITEEFSAQITSTISSFLQDSTRSMLNSVSDFILKLPALLLQSIVTLFVFFFVLRDKEEFLFYTKELLPFSKEMETELVKSTKGVTSSVIYGQVLVGMIQGVIMGLGFLLFGVSNAFVLMALSMMVGIFPIVGPFLVWVPVLIYLLISGEGVAAIGVLIFGSVASLIDNILRPIIVSKRTKVKSLFILIGMVGGLLFFGVIGIILGPLIIAYLLIFLELYRNKRISGMLLEGEKKERWNSKLNS